jgi:hypothetical protein
MHVQGRGLMCRYLYFLTYIWVWGGVLNAHENIYFRVGGGNIDKLRGGKFNVKCMNGPEKDLLW